MRDDPRVEPFVSGRFPRTLKYLEVGALGRKHVWIDACVSRATGLANLPVVLFVAIATIVKCHEP